MNLTKTFLLLTLFLSSTAAVFAANAGDLDPTFGSGGKVFNLPAGLAFAEDVAIQPDGKIVIVGSATGPDMTDDFGVVRLNADGSPDMGFGSGGFVRIPFDLNFDELASAVVIQADGKIVVAGSVELGTAAWDIGVVRLNSNGTLDGTYSGGKVKINVSVNPAGGNDFARDMIIQPDGMVVIVGVCRPTPNNDIAIVRLNTTGAIDGQFRIRVDIGSGGNDEANAVALQPDGSLVVAGQTGGDFCLLRFFSTGGLDTNFGLGGLVQTPIGTQGDVANTVAIQADGKIVAAGTANSGSSDLIAFARYTSGGALDSTFDGDGKVTYDVLQGLSDSIRSIVIQADGKIIGVGPGAGPYLLMRLTTTGALDPTFGVGGTSFQNVGPAGGGGSPHRAVLQPDGKLVAVGDGGAPGGPFGFTAGRFFTVATPTSRSPFDFDGDNKTDIGIFRGVPTGAEWWINRSSNGSTFALQFGNSTDRIVPADYTGDGKTDIAIWRPSTGQWFVLRSEDNSFYAFPFGTSEDVPASADYNNDGKADPAVFRASVGMWFIATPSGGVDLVPFGQNGDRPVPADYDGDGKADIAIYRPSNGQWWLRRSTAGVLALHFGEFTDKQVQGDYTGDGKADVAFWRPSSGEWFILRSEDSSYYAFQFGITGDLLTPGDYDGDGKFDPTVFRSATATWYSGRTTAGMLIVQFGVNGDRPIPNAYVP